MTDRLRPLALLVVATGLVLAAVLLSGRMLVGGSADAGTDHAGPVAAAGGTTPTPTRASLPTELGGVLTISGDRNATLEVTARDRSADGYTMAGHDGRITFLISPDGPWVDHLVYKELDFFLEPGQCGLIVGDLNPDLGLASVTVRCVDITDVRSRSTVDVEGTLTVAANAVIVQRDDLPEQGGTLTVSGDLSLTIRVPGASWRVFQVDNPRFSPTPQPITLSGERPAGEATQAVIVAQGESSNELWVSQLLGLGHTYDVAPRACPVMHEEVGVLGPDTTEQRLAFDCADLSIESLGTVDISGSVVATRSIVPFPP